MPLPWRLRVTGACSLNKLLTVCVPLFNLEHVASRPLESLAAIAPEFLDLVEVLMVDDGSTDGTPRVCRHYERADPTVFRYIRKDNGHWGSAVNRGIKEARGRYFKVLDGDDSFDKNGFQALLCALKKGRFDLVVTDYRKRFEGSGECALVSLGATEVTGDSVEDLGLSGIQMHSITYGVDLLRRCGLRLDEGIPYTDTEYRLFPMPFVRSCRYLPVEVYQYHLERNGQSMDPDVYYCMSSVAASKVVFRSVLGWYDRAEKGFGSVGGYCGGEMGSYGAALLRKMAIAGVGRDELLRVDSELRTRSGAAEAYARSRFVRLLRLVGFHGATRLSKALLREKKL